MIRRFNKILFGIMPAMLLIACADAPTIPAAPAEKNQSPDQFPVLSYNIVDTKKINKTIHEAIQNKEEWAQSPLLIVYKYLKTSIAVPFVSIVAKSPGGEEPSSVTVTVTESGYLDDSVAGGWFQFYLDRNNAKSIWQVKEIRQANLCGRMNSLNSFSKENCP